MPVIEQTIDSIINGVSQRHPAQRDPSRAEEQINAVSTRTQGVAVRPPTEHVAKLTGIEGANLQSIKTSDGRVFYVAILANDIRVFDAKDGSEVEVEFFGNPEAYLTNPERIRTAVGDGVMYLVDTGRTTLRGSVSTPKRPNGVLVEVRQAVEGIEYRIVLNGVEVVHEATADDDTEAVANQLALALFAEPELVGFKRRVFGSTLHIFRQDDAKIDISVSDGLGDNGLNLVTDKAQRFADLPQYAPPGFMVLIAGDPESDADDYWVRYEDASLSNKKGVWKECAAPGSTVSLDASTLPHVLEYQGRLMGPVEASDLLGIHVVGRPLFGDSPPTITAWEGVEFPEGVTLTVSAFPAVQGMSPAEWQYTIQGGDTYVDIIGGFIAEISADPDWSHNRLQGPISDTIEVFPATNPEAIVLLYLASDLGGDSAFIPGAGMTHNSLVGLTLVNRTDGSTGTITSNTSNVIRTSGLTGGASGATESGDSIEVVSSGDYFTFRPGSWVDRAAGDENSNPSPSFINRPIADVFVYEGRLGFLSGSSVVLSEVGNPFNLYRTTVTQVLAGDRIDVTLRAGHHFIGAVEWNGGMYLITPAGPYKLYGDPVLTPETVAILPVISTPMTDEAEPLPVGGRLFFARSQTRGAQVSYLIDPPRESPDTRDVTAHVPEYLKGSPVQLVGDDTLQTLVVLTTERDRLFVFMFDYSGNQVQQESWSRWELPPGASVRSMVMVDGVLGLVVEYSDGTYLETLDLGSLLSDR